ncbi:hypothetical protein GOP47_0013133 [Adiantum capillus-veneris]|uniref:Uncharacterized protein n=1 Tax=Adiantum capillus-veneris TaxID=13818 RepID=A0A9D4ZE92_ADICA|nr:hypothetical protein GOP47_0013133 [Adiantum capillus-veneris]
MQLREKFQEGDDLARELLQIGWPVMCTIDSKDANNGSLLALINQCSRRPPAYQESWWPTLCRPKIQGTNEISGFVAHVKGPAFAISLSKTLDGISCHSCEKLCFTMLAEPWVVGNGSDHAKWPSVGSKIDLWLTKWISQQNFRSTSLRPAKRTWRRACSACSSSFSHMCFVYLSDKLQRVGDEQAVGFNIKLHGTSTSTLATSLFKQSRNTGKEIEVYKGHQWIIHMQPSQLLSIWWMGRRAPCTIRLLDHLFK